MGDSLSHLDDLLTRFITVLVTILEYPDLFPLGIQPGVEVFNILFPLLRSLYVFIST